MAERKTPKQRAQDDLDLAIRVKERAQARKERVDAENGALVEKYTRLAQEKKDEITKADEDLKAANNRVAFLGTHPDLNDDEPEAGDDGEQEQGGEPDDGSDVL